MSNHLVHAPLPEGALIEIAPSQVELAKIDGEGQGYAITATDGSVTIRIVMPAEDYVTLIRSGAAQLDSEGAASGKLQVVGALPPELRGPNRALRRNGN